MASSDVIELGSSEDETEPVPKKKKPTPNAMVHFPNEVPGLVIKPVKPPLPNLQKVLAGGVTITNVKKMRVPIQVQKSKPNGRPVQKVVHRPPLKIPILRNVSATNPTVVNSLSVNPLNLMKKQQNIHNRVQASKLSLPPGITVTRTPTSQNVLPNIIFNRRKQSMKRKQPAKIITTVELDDEEAPLPSGTNPQWYLRPEEESIKTTEKIEDESKDEGDVMEKNINMELENNKEPDTRNYIEITIEDSPIKPLNVMKGFEVGSELPITIEDSPIKPIKEPLSDGETKKSNVLEPQSKKRLDYPKEGVDSEKNKEHNIVEIDVEMLPSNINSKEVNVEICCTNEIDETRKDSQSVLMSKETKDEEKLNTSNIEQKNYCGEFHPIYQKFIDLCFELENSDDMKKIVEKKIKTYYRQCPKDYVVSEEFTDMVSSKIFAMKAAPDKMYLYIKDIVDELNLQRKTAKAVEISNKETDKADMKYSIADDGEYDTKRRRQIRKLDKTIKKLHRAIQKLEEQEVEFEDEEDSVYLLTERYKERLIRVHTKFCQLTNTKMPSEPRIQIEARPGLPTGPARRLEKWVNRKVPIGTPLPFPDFHDVLRCVREANEEDELGWNEANIMEEARDLFTRCGKKLQRRRQENEWRIAAARISHDVSTLDPADKSDDLKKKLEENTSIAAKREIELFNKYADKQNQLKLVGEEIGDKEAEESPVESEEDEGNDESNSLEDKQKRKERLKRLLHEKTRKISSGKENIINEAKDKGNENVVKEGEEKVTKVDSNKDEVIGGEQKVLCDTISEKTDTKIDDNHEVSNESEIISNNNITNIFKDEAKNEEKEDLYDVDSDIDELHLLQKLYSENEINSSTQESDSDTPIAISDTLESDSDNENVKIQQSDIISIENSSYSESEVTKDGSECLGTAESVKNKRVDGLLLQNTEVLMHSSSSSYKIDLEEENILLASSDGESDLELSRAKLLNSKEIKLSNAGGSNNNCENIFDNSAENYLQNDIVMYEVPLIEENVDKIQKRITSVNNKLDGNQDHIKLNETINKQTTTKMCNDIEVNKSVVSLVNVEEKHDELEKVRNKINSDLEVSCDEDNGIKSRVIYEKEKKNNCEIDNYKYSKSDCANDSLNVQKCIDKNDFKINPRKEINSECHNDHLDNLGDHEYCSESNFVKENASNGIKNSVDSQFSKCGVMDVNVEITEDESSLPNQQSTCVEVEVSPSVNAS